MLRAAQDPCHLLDLTWGWSQVLNGFMSPPFRTLAYQESASLDPTTLVALEAWLQYLPVYGDALRFHGGHDKRQLDEECFAFGLKSLSRAWLIWSPSESYRSSKERFNIFFLEYNATGGKPLKRLLAPAF